MHNENNIYFLFSVSFSFFLWFWGEIWPVNEWFCEIQDCEWLWVTIFLYDFRLPWVIVCHDYLGKRVFQVPPSTVIRYIKTLIYQETDYPVSQQQLFHNGKLVSFIKNFCKMIQFIFHMMRREYPNEEHHHVITINPGL